MGFVLSPLPVAAVVKAGMLKVGIHVLSVASKWMKERETLFFHSFDPNLPSFVRSFVR